MLILETGVGLDTANAYADGAALASYAGARLYATAYVAADGPTREKALMMATRMIDAGMQWEGTRATPVQRLDWPRAYVPRQWSLLQPTDVVSTFYGAGLAQRYWLPTEIPRLLADAVCEYALELLKRDRTVTPDFLTDGVKKIALGEGAIDVEFATAAEASKAGALFPDFVARQLSIFGQPAGRRSMVPVRRGL